MSGASLRRLYGEHRENTNNTNTNKSKTNKSQEEKTKQKRWNTRLR